MSLYKLFEWETKNTRTYENIFCVIGLRKVIQCGYHGELIDMQRGSQTEPIDVEMRDRLEDMIHDLGQESFQQAYAPMYDTLESDSKKPLYLGCKKSLTLLSVVLSLVNVKA